jgi:hypothetical protein
LLGSLLVVEPLDIRQPQRLQFIHGDHDLFEGARGDTGRLKVGAARLQADSSALFRSWHVLLLLVSLIGIMRIWALQSSEHLTGSKEDWPDGISNIALDVAGAGVVVTGANPEVDKTQSGIQAE